jgi:hypothetical protein
MIFELADSRRHIGLDTIELDGGPDDAALIHDGPEYPKRLQIYRSHAENNIA